MRNAEGDLTQTDRRGEGNVTMSTDWSDMAKECQKSPELEEARNKFSPRACGGDALDFDLVILISDLWPPDL